MKKSKKKHKTEVIDRDGELIVVDADKTTLWDRLKNRLSTVFMSAVVTVAAVLLVSVLALCFAAMLVFLLVAAAIIIAIAMIKVVYDLAKDACKQHKRRSKSK